MSRMSEHVRRQFQEDDAVRDAGLTIPEDVERHVDILYGADETWQKLDVYRPAGQEGNVLPVIVSVHGGGWVYGDKELYQYYCMNLAQRGFAVVNFTYRLAPEFPFPAAMEDTNLVFSWMLLHAGEYGLDTGHVFAVGDSAGANMLGLYAAACTNPAYAACYDFSLPEGFCPQALALNCGVYQPRILDDPEDMMSELLKDYLPQKGTREELAQICLAEHITKDFPPTFLMTSSGDFLKEEAPVLAQTLVKKNVPFQFRYYTAADAGCPDGDTLSDTEQAEEPGHVFHLNMRRALAARCNAEECAFFRQYL